jgi:D-glycero-D-manno-heptose 1,7-bisphosphate phosphatase
MKSMDIYKDYDTLFLDRDGTINRRIVDGYVTSWEEFEFLPGVLEALYRFSQNFDPIIIVTNQQGVGRDIMTHEELGVIHNNMVEVIKENQGRIDQIYYCPQLKVFNPLCRKPNPGMAMQAQEDFPSIDFNRSIMIGDTDSDIQFGKNLGMLTVRISNKDSEVNVSADITVDSLLEFSKWNIDLK